MSRLGARNVSQELCSRDRDQREEKAKKREGKEKTAALLVKQAF